MTPSFWLLLKSSYKWLTYQPTCTKKEENWYTNEISYEKHVEFKEWWLKEAQEQFRYTKAHTIKAWGWFDLSYGLKVPIQQGNEDL